MDWNLYLPISLAMFLEFAIWGAWMPVLAMRLMGPLKMTPKQTGWIYATLPLACIFAPLISGQIADQWINVEWLLAACHLIGAVLLFIAARTTSFGKLFGVMFAYSICYTATLPLVNSLLFANISDPGTQGLVFLWAPVAWALACYCLTGWRLMRKGEGDGSDCLYFAAALSVVMGLAAFVLPTTAPAKAGFALGQALGMLADPNYLLFILASMAVAGMMQFYFLGTGRFMSESGISAKVVPASMGLAQAVQAGATFGLAWYISTLGFPYMLGVGAACWTLLFFVYVMGKPTGLIVGLQGLHGLAYVMFMIGGQIYVNSVPEHAKIISSAQALIFAATNGVGLFLGTQLASLTMERFSVDGKLDWRKIWMVPMGITAVGAILLAFVFQGPPEEPTSADPATPPAVEAEA